MLHLLHLLCELELTISMLQLCEVTMTMLDLLCELPISISITITMLRLTICSNKSAHLYQRSTKPLSMNALLSRYSASTKARLLD